ncbi:hypothetical protein K9U40_11065 [Xanthobacter autotrophicus]|uniref:hypothetical protein n=1 Tax=Xanthobacter TaxID=279 RepID=UPI0024AAF5BC|nr:hypothetical protein [Xanthobacter autotrophicus]MDI4664865.1 hypothetical protein [Xanthobacter autotrophicus]
MAALKGARDRDRIATEGGFAPQPVHGLISACPPMKGQEKEMKRMAFTLCALTLLAGTAPAFAGGAGCAGMTNASSGATTTTASTPVTPKGG